MQQLRENKERKKKEEPQRRAEKVNPNAKKLKPGQTITEIKVFNHDVQAKNIKSRNTGSTQSEQGQTRQDDTKG